MTVPKDSRSSPTSCSSVTSSRDSSSAFAASKRGVMPEPTAMVRLSPAMEVAIRLLPGNDRCVDCKAVCPQWAGVSFGVLLCLACAGKHRSLGVQTSFVKSLVMDAWSANEVCALELGGNAKWVAVCAGTGVSDLPMETKYSSGVAKAYKSRVALAAAKDPSVECAFTATSFLSMLAGIAGAESPVSIVKEDPASSPTMTMKMQPISDPADDTSVKCTTCCSMVPLAELNSHSRSCTVSASVSRVLPGGAAERANVIVGSLLIGLNNTKNLKFDELWACFEHGVRGVKTVISTVPEPTTVEINVTLHDKEELGCSLAENEFNCVVRNVDEDCIARRHGILVGSRVVAVNGQKYLKPKNLIREICTAQRPIKITVHRVEGLMRGWSS
ncbi:PDZ domain [Phytophthora cactorum]|nr:PDZ domain [Phytophthora cactorum]